MPDTGYPHIAINDDSVPLIAGTTTKVVEIVQDHLAHSWDGVEIRRQYPSLTLGQIHSALAYYYDHREEIDQDIERRRERVADLQSRHGSSMIGDRLRTVTGKP